MSADGSATSPDDPRVEEAVKTWAIAPRLTVQKVMLAAGFTPSDAATRSKQAWIRRRAPSKQERMGKPPDAALLSPGSTVSSLTNASSEPAHPFPKAPKKRQSSSPRQDERARKKQMKKHKKKAHKRDMFKAMEIPIRQKEIGVIEKDKEFRVSMEKLEMEARAILCKSKGPGTYIGRELDVLLKWYGCKMSDFNNVGQKKLEWQSILDEKRDPPPYEKWTEADEARLEELKKLKKLEINIEDTELGRLRDLKKREMLESVSNMSTEELDQLQERIDDRKPAAQAEAVKRYKRAHSEHTFCSPPSIASI